MASAVYLMCTATAVLCAALLLSGFRRSGSRLLLWSGLCFAMLALDNLVLFVDMIVIPEVDLRYARGAAALSGVCLLLYGLIWEEK